MLLVVKYNKKRLTKKYADHIINPVNCLLCKYLNNLYKLNVMVTHGFFTLGREEGVCY